jgi:hypothetical protein
MRTTTGFKGFVNISFFRCHSGGGQWAFNRFKVSATPAHCPPVTAYVHPRHPLLLKSDILNFIMLIQVHEGFIMHFMMWMAQVSGLRLYLVGHHGHHPWSSKVVLSYPSIHQKSATKGSLARRKIMTLDSIHWVIEYLHTPSHSCVML